MTACYENFLKVVCTLYPFCNITRRPGQYWVGFTIQYPEQPELSEAQIQKGAGNVPRGPESVPIPQH